MSARSSAESSTVSAASSGADEASTEEKAAKLRELAKIIKS